MPNMVYTLLLELQVLLLMPDQARNSSSNEAKDFSGYSTIVVEI